MRLWCFLCLVTLVLAENVVNKRRKRSSMRYSSDDIAMQIEEEYEVDDKLIGAVVHSRKRRDLSGDVTQECSSGSVWSTVDLTCSECAAGSYASVGVCTPCPKGTYQPLSGRTSCVSCDSTTSTLSVGQTSSSDCTAICRVPEVGYGTVSPEPGWDLSQGGQVTITCNSGYKINNQNVHKTTCADELPSCSEIHTEVEHTEAISGSTVSVTCQVISEDAPTDCSWLKNNVEISGYTASVTSSGDMHYCYLTLTSFSSNNEAEYMCTATINSYDEAASTTVTMSILEMTYADSDLALKTGSTTTLTCKATNPQTLDVPVRISWMKDNIAFGMSQVYVSDDPAVATEELYQVTVSDKGEYQCVALYTGIGTITSEERQIYIRAFKDELIDKWVITGNTATLQCVTVGDQSGTFVWKKDSVAFTNEVSTSYDSSTLTTTSTVTLTNTDSSDQGEYSCTATYSDTTLYSAAQLYVYDEGLAIQPIDKTVSVGDTCTFTCVAGNPSSNLVTGFKWYKGSTEVTAGITSTDTGNTQYQSLLEVTSIAFSDAGQYYCVVAYTDSSFQDVESDRPSLYVRGFSVSPEAVNPSEGSTVSISCTANGDEPTALAWYIDSTKITSGGDSVITTGDYDSSAQTMQSVVVISDVATGDEGAYTCQATYSDSTVETSTSATLTIYNAVISGEVAIIGSSVTITCTISSDREPEDIAWTLDNEPVSTSRTTFSEAYDASTSTKESKLILSEVIASDFGEYGCTAYYDGFSTVIRALPVEFSELKFTEEPKNKTMSAGSALTLSCSITHPSTYTDTPNLDWYKGDDVITGDITVSSSGELRSSVLTIASVGISDDGEYTCKASYPGVSGELQTEVAVIIVRGFSSDPGDQYLVAGYDGYMTCVVKTESEPMISWLFNGSAIVDGFTNTWSYPYLTSIVLLDGITDTYIITCRATVDGITVESEEGSVRLVSTITLAEATHVLDGSTTSLQCSAESEQSPYVEWYKDGVLSTAPETNTDAGGVYTSTLTFSAITMDDAGSYKCVVVWPADGDFLGGELPSNPFTLSVTGLKTSPSDTQVLTSKTATLTCAFVSTGEATSIEWYQDNTAIDAASETDITTAKSYSSVTHLTTGTLVTNSVASSAGGSYYCKATYDIGTIDSDPATLEVVEQGFSQVSSEQIVRVGSPLTLTCQTLYADTNTVKWYKAGVEVTDNTATAVVSSTSDKHTLEFASIVSGDMADYYCDMDFTDTSTSNVKSQIIPIRIREFSVSPSAQVVRAGDRLTLTCVVSGDYPDSLRFYKNAEKMSALAVTYSYETSATDATSAKSELTINAASDTFSADYHCVATWNSGTPATLNSSTAEVVSVNVVQKDVYAIKDQSRELDCSVSSTKEPTSIAFYNGASLLSTITAITDVSDVWTASHNIATIADSDFSSEYVCVALVDGVLISSGDYGSLSNSSVKEVELLSYTSSVSLGVGTSLTLTCSASLVSDTTVTVVWYKDGVAQSGATSGSAGTSYQTALALTSFSSSDTGTYQCSMVYADVGTLTSPDIIIGVNAFQTSPTTQSSFAGDSLTLTCTIQANADVIWNKDGTDMDSSRFTTTSTSALTTSTVVISSSSTTNAGSYYCEADIGSQTITSDSATLTVYEFTSIPTFTKVIEGSPATLSCSVKQTPSDPVITWQRDGADYSEAGVTTTSGTLETNTLTFSSPVYTESGNFRCKAVFPDSSDGSFTGGTLYSDAGKLLVLGFATESAYVSSTGDTLTATCAISADSEATSIKWYKDSVFVNATADDDITVVANYASSTYTTTGVITIANFDSDDTANYKCVAELSGDLTVTSSNISIDLSTVFMIPGYGADGKEASMYCLYSGTRTIGAYDFEKEQSDDSWSNSYTSGYTKAVLTDAELAIVKAYANSSFTDVTTGWKMTVSALTSSDTGTYRCALTDDLSVIVYTLGQDLEMVSATVTPSKVLTGYGDKASFTCTVQGPGTAVVEAWLFSTNTSVFTKDSSVMIVYQRFTNGTTVAVITKVMGDSNLVYQCRATVNDETYPAITTTITTAPDQAELLWGFVHIYGDTFEVYEGSDFYSYCYHVSTTGHTVSVTAPDGTVGSNTATTLTTLEKMIWYNVKPSDSGNYTWTMTINSEVISQSLTLTVKPLPAEPSAPTAYIQQRVEYPSYIVCAINDSIPILIDWYMDGWYQSGYTVVTGDDQYKRATGWMYAYDINNNTDHKCYGRTRSTWYTTGIRYLAEWYTQVVSDQRSMTWTTFDQEFTTTSVYAGEDITLTCRAEPNATLYVWNYGYETLTTNYTAADGYYEMATYDVSSASTSDWGQYWCFYVPETGGNVYGWLGIWRRCSALIEPDSSLSDLSCSTTGSVIDAYDTCNYTCASGYSMLEKHGDSIESECMTNGYWTHMYTSWVRQTMPDCIEQKTPKGAKITANKRITKNCGTQQAKDDLWTLITQKWEDLDYVSAATVTVEMRSILYVADTGKCYIKWRNTATSTGAAADVKQAKIDQKVVLRASSLKRDTDDDDDDDDNSIELECNTGEGADSSGEFCLECPAGTYSVDNECVDCPLASYSTSTGSTTCTACGVGKGTLTAGSTAATDCQDTCTVTGTSFASMDPPEDYIVADGSPVTTYCEAGYIIGNAGTATHTCGTTKYCSSVTMVSTDSASYSAGQDYSVTCTAETADPDAEIIWFIANVESACDSGSAGECVITATPSANKLVSVLSGTAASSAMYNCSLSSSEATVKATYTHQMTVLTNTVTLSSNVAQVGEKLTVTCSGTFTSDMSDYPTVNAFLNGVDIGGDRVNEVLTASFVVPFTAEVHCTFNYFEVTETQSIDSEDIYEAAFYQAPHYNTKLALDTSSTIICESNFASTAVWSEASDGTQSEVATATMSGADTTSSATATLPAQSSAVSIQYWCRATQTVSGASDVTIDTTAVTYTFSASDVITDPTDQYSAGAETKFTCVVPSGSTVTWKKDGDTGLDLSGKTSHTSSTNEEYVLTFPSPTVDDQGVYYCTGSGGRSSGAKLNFVSITTNPSDMWVASGDSDYINCVATGDVSITFVDPSGDEFVSGTSDDVTSVYSSGYTRAVYKYSADISEAGNWYCSAKDLTDSDTATITKMDVTFTMSASVVRDGDEYSATMVVIGYHDGLELTNNGGTLEIVSPSTIETDKLSTGGTTYTWSQTLNGTLADSAYVAVVYYNSYAITYSTTVSVEFLGFPSGAPDDAAFVEGANTITATVAGPGTLTVALVNSASETIVSTTSSEGLVALSKTFEGADSGTYVITVTTADGTLTDTSDKFDIQVYGAKTAEYTINYPGPADTSSEDRITLTCVIMTPRLTNVIWYKYNDGTSSNDALAALSQYQATSWADKELTSTYQVEIDDGVYYCKTTFDGSTISVKHTVAMLSYALSLDASSAQYFDTDLTFTNNVASYSAELAITVTNSIGAVVDTTSGVIQESASEVYTSNIVWTDASGLHSGNYETTNTIYVAGVYMEQQEQQYAKPEGTGPVTCNATSTSTLTPTKIVLDSNGSGSFGGSSTKTETLNGVTANSVESFTTDITYNNNIDTAKTTCTVTYNDGTATTVTRSAEMEVTMGINCSISTALEYGSYSIPVGTSFETGASVSVTCDASYQLHGQNSYTCSFGELWDTAPECKRINPQCPAITLADHFMSFSIASNILTLECQDSMAPFSNAFSTIRCLQNGWDSVDKNTPVVNYNMCGNKMTPSAKSLTMFVNYFGAAPLCNTDAEKDTVYSIHSAAAPALDGTTSELVSCDPTTDGYLIAVKYTQKTSTLTSLDLLDATTLEANIIKTNGTESWSRRKRATKYYLGDITADYELECPLSAPHFEGYCVECPVGTYSDGDECLKCPKGEYQHIAGSLYCLACLGTDETTAGTGTTTISECGAECRMEVMQNGLTVPPANSEVTDPTSVVVVCDEGYSLPVTASADTTCQAVTYSCNKDCVVSVDNKTINHIDILASLSYISGETFQAECVEDYSTDDGSTALQITCTTGVLSSVSECKKGGLSTGIIVLIVLLVLLALLLLIIIPLCCLMNQGGRSVSDTPDKMEYDVELRPQSSYSCSNHVLIKGSKTDQRIMNSNPFKVSAMNEHIRGMTVGLNEGFIREFRSITVGSDSKKVISQMSENFHKNRYSTITTYDHSRVRLLKINNDPYSDYVNASYINGYVSPNAYIATQGPVQSTVEDFWRMVWEQNVSSIVMLTNLIQKGQMKCHKYWPDNIEQFGVVKVKKMSENKMAGFVVRELEIEVEEKKRTVFQYHYMDWPDVGYPDETKFLSFMYYIRHLRQDSTTPIVVHCSAGAGWTGVFIGLDITLDRLTREDNIDVLGCVNAMRQQRSAMVQNEPQYIYLHKLLLDAVNNYTFNKLRANRFRQNLDGAIFVNPDAPSDDYEGGL